MKTPFIHILWMFKCQVSQHVEKLAKEMVALQVALRPRGHLLGPMENGGSLSMKNGNIPWQNGDFNGDLMNFHGC